MSVIFRGDSTGFLSSTAFENNPITLRDTRPSLPIYSDAPNAVRVIGDGGFDYVYQRGKNRASITLDWGILDYNTVYGLKKVWSSLNGSQGWFWLQTSDMSANAQALRTNTNAGTTPFLRDAAIPTGVVGNNFINKWVVVVSPGANQGKKLRITNHFTDGSIGLESSLTLIGTEQFYIGWPVRIVSPFSPVLFGNRADFFSLKLECETVIF